MWLCLSLITQQRRWRGKTVNASFIGILPVSSRVHLLIYSQRKCQEIQVREGDGREVGEERGLFNMFILLIRSSVWYWYAMPSGAPEAKVSNLMGALAKDFESTASLKVFLFTVNEEMQQWERGRNM